MSTVAETATLAHGYTMADLDGMARKAARYRYSSILDPEDALSIAWLAIIDALYSNESAPSRYDLINAGTKALAGEIKRLISYHGINALNTGDRLNGSAAPHFQKYWSAHHSAKDEDFTERIAERLALPAVLGALTPKQYEAVATLAAFDGDSQAAAAALGMGLGSYRSNLAHARQRLKALWFEHETPRSWKNSSAEQCRNGHNRAEHGHQDENGKWKCFVCRRSTDRRAQRKYQARQKTAALAES